MKHSGKEISLTPVTLYPIVFLEKGLSYGAQVCLKSNHLDLLHRLKKFFQKNKYNVYLYSISFSF